jgi:hypothetical protein
MTGIGIVEVDAGYHAISVKWFTKPLADWRPGDGVRTGIVGGGHRRNRTSEAMRLNMAVSGFCHASQAISGAADRSEWSTLSGAARLAIKSCRSIWHSAGRFDAVGAALSSMSANFAAARIDALRL